MDNVVKAGTTNSEILQPIWLETSYEGILGTYEYNQETHAVKDGEDYLPVSFRQIQNGKDVVIWPESLKTSETAEYDPFLW